jgi:hypothetical protein
VQTNFYSDDLKGATRAQCQVVGTHCAEVSILGWNFGIIELNTSFPSW